MRAGEEEGEVLSEEGEEEKVMEEGVVFEEVLVP